MAASMAEAQTPEALILDFDGTVVDTESPELVSYKQLFAGYGVRFPEERWLATIGGELTFDAYSYLQREVEVRLPITKIRNRRRQLHRELVLREGLRPGVREYVQRARELGLKLGVASSAKADWVIPLLRHYELDECFNTVVTADDVANVKPDPELFRTAVARLGVSATRTIAVEDSVNGMRAAIRAGLVCVVVPNDVTSKLDWPDEPRAHYLSSLTDITLDELVRWIAARA